MLRLDMVIRYRLNELLQARNLTAKQVAGMTGIAESTISEIRRNRAKRIDAQTIDRLCAVLDCTPGDLIVREVAHLDAAPPRLLAEDAPPYDPHA